MPLFEIRSHLIRPPSSLQDGMETVDARESQYDRFASSRDAMNSRFSNRKRGGSHGSGGSRGSSSSSRARLTSLSSAMDGVLSQMEMMEHKTKAAAESMAYDIQSLEAEQQLLEDVLQDEDLAGLALTGLIDNERQPRASAESSSFEGGSGRVLGSGKALQERKRERMEQEASRQLAEAEAAAQLAMAEADAEAAMAAAEQRLGIGDRASARFDQSRSAPEVHPSSSASALTTDTDSRDVNSTLPSLSEQYSGGLRQPQKNYCHMTWSCVAMNGEQQEVEVPCALM
mmetsp:Transcript_20404/g.66273  ORF Transcript_20404/g.66273 Transcript_20404/m.66273 type:complete len:286 (-) Transcript_20404:63-920(-)